MSLLYVFLLLVKTQNQFHLNHICDTGSRGLLSGSHICSDVFLGQVYHKTFQYLRLQATSNM